MKKAIATILGYGIVIMVMPLVYLGLWVQDLIDSHYLNKRKFK